MDKSKVFKRAWSDYKFLKKHKMKKPFGTCLSYQFEMAKLIDKYNGAEGQKLNLNN
jgi:hypothetical protein